MVAVRCRCRHARSYCRRVGSFFYVPIICAEHLVIIAWRQKLNHMLSQKTRHAHEDRSLERLLRSQSARHLEHLIQGLIAPCAVPLWVPLVLNVAQEVPE